MKTNTNTQPDTLEVKQWKTRRKGAVSIWDPKIIRAAIPESFKKLDPRVQVKNPVMFVVEIGSVVTTIEFVRLLFTAPTAAFPRATLTAETIFVLAVAIWLWFTVVFANFAEAMAEGRGKAQADTLRRARTTTLAKRLANRDRFGPVQEVAAPELLDIAGETDATKKAYGLDQPETAGFGRNCLVARRMIEAKGAGIAVSASTERRDVLPGAGVVVTTIGVGGRRAWEADVLIPRRYGVFQPVGDAE